MDYRTPHVVWSVDYIPGYNLYISPNDIWPKSNDLTRAQNDIMDQIYSNIRREIQSIQVVSPKPNFSQRLRMALKSLREDPSIIIAKADKGDSVVVINLEQYYGLAAKHLADSRTY